jgi:PadR family transcriptional regulator PadR
MSAPDLPKGRADVLILAMLEERDRHGYEIAKLIETRSKGAFTYHIASLYPMLYRLEGRGLIRGRWLEEAGARRRRFYRVTPKGRTFLNTERRQWRTFFSLLSDVAGIKHA